MGELVAGTVLGNRFEVVGVLGYGGMATVYLVKDSVRGEEVALKVLHDHLARSPSMRARLRREVRTAAKITTPHALVAWDLHEVDGLLALSMRVHKGQTLTDLVGSKGPLDVPVLTGIARQLASALAEAHRLGIVHRDVTPPNVLVDAAGAAVLTDFGLARSVHQATMTGTQALGTAGYAAPEVYQGVRTDPRSDLYSLGAVLYFAATGHPPFEASDPVGVLRRQIEGAYRPLPEARPGLPGLFVDIVHTLLSVDVRERPPDAMAVVELLDQNRWDPHARIHRVLAKTFPIGPRLDEPIDRPLPSLDSVVRAAALGAVVGLPPAAVLFWGMLMAVLTGPWLALPPGSPPHAAVNALAFTVLGLIAALMPGLGASAAAHARIRRGGDSIDHDRASGPAPILLVGMLGTAVSALPGAVLVAGAYTLAFYVPPLIVVPALSATVATIVNVGSLVGAIGLAVALLWVGMLAVPEAARRYVRLALVGSPPTHAIRQREPWGDSAADRARAELFDLELAIAHAEQLPEPAVHDLQVSVRGLLDEVDRIGFQLDGLHQELAGTSSTEAAASVARLETRLARARTLATGGESEDLAGLELALGAELEVLAQADRVEDALTQATARLLELRALAARCRVELLAPDEAAEAQQKRLMERLATALGDASRAVAELAPVPELAPTA